MVLTSIIDFYNIIIITITTLTLTLTLVSVTREPRAHDSEAKGPREALELGSSDGEHH